jgi:hypothetical protein
MNKQLTCPYCGEVIPVAELREHPDWKMLGEKYGVNPKTLEQHIRRYRKAVGI